MLIFISAIIIVGGVCTVVYFVRQLIRSNVRIMASRR